jgi:hypothetical protein
VKDVGVVSEHLYKKIKKRSFFAGQNLSVYVWYCAKTPNFGEALAITSK